MKVPYVEYGHNNSGGRDWLTPEDWENLRKAGWEIKENPYAKGNCSLFTATRYGVDYDEAADEWTEITGGNLSACGCSCCGHPHYLSAYDSNGKYIRSNDPYCYDEDW
jgi:hypothetical protein